MKTRSEKIVVLSFVLTLVLIFLFVVYVEFIKKDETSIVLNTTHKKIETLKDIVPIKDKNVSAIVYTNAIRLPDTMNTKKRKKAFIDMLLPSILISKYKISQLRKKVLYISKKDKLTNEEKVFLNKLYRRCKTTKNDMLLTKMTTHPVSVVLAQAAVESGWGSSRFFIKANNIFGVWSFNKKEKRISALGMRGAKTIYLKKYDSMEESITDYFRTLGTSRSFKSFRDGRILHNEPLRLIDDLKHYSELREEYVEKLRKVITYNKLDKYDSYRLSPESFKEVEAD